jgi:predicted dehydrogenase
MTDFVVAVIGLGSIGLRHARNLRSLGMSVLGFDPDGKRQIALTEIGGEACSSRDVALTGATMAVVSSPNELHLDDARAAIEAGCHTLIEKPFAHIGEGVEELLKVAAAKNLVLALAHNLRFHPAIEAAHSLITEGILGNLLWGRFLCSTYLPDWRPDQDYRLNYTANATTGGVLFDIIHEFDLAYYLLGPGRTIAASALRTGTLEIDSEDCADVIIRHDCGAQSSLHLDYISRPRRRSLEIMGTNGFVEIDILGRRLTMTSENGELIKDQTFSGSNSDTYHSEIVDFCSAIKENSTPRCSGEDGLAVLHQVLAARQLCGLPQS